MTDLRYYLLLFDALASELAAEPREFTDEAEAQAAFAEAERRNRGEGALRVLLFYASSLDALSRTHPHYFRNGAEQSGVAADSLIPT